MKPQLVVIHGGMVYESHDAYIHALKEEPVDISYFQRTRKWKDRLEEDLGDVFEILRPEMPNPRYAKYDVWCIWFQRMLPFLRDEVILVGHSLGGIFLARYLNEHDLPVKVRATVLIAAPFDDESHESLGDFRIVGMLDRFARQGGDIHIWASQDDPVVAFAELERYKKAVPNAKTRVFADHGHFSLERFPELTDFIRKIR